MGVTTATEAGEPAVRFATNELYRACTALRREADGRAHWEDVLLPLPHVASVSRFRDRLDKLTVSQRDQFAAHAYDEVWLGTQAECGLDEVRRWAAEHDRPAHLLDMTNIGCGTSVSDRRRTH